MNHKSPIKEFGLDASTCTIPGLLRAAAGCWPQKPLFRHNGKNGLCSFEEISRLTAQMKNALHAFGVRRGDSVALLMPTCLESIVFFYGAASIGAVTIPMDCAMGSDTMLYILGQSEPQIVFCRIRNRSQLLNIGWPAGRIVTVESSGIDTEEDFAQLLEKAPPVIIDDKPDTEDPAVILYTSGSTGFPKGVVLSHQALCRSGFQFSCFYGWTGEDILLNLAELHTMSGLRNTCITPLWQNSSVHLCLPEERRSVFEIVGRISSSGCTLLGCAPIFIRQLQLFQDRIEGADLEKVRVIFCTGAFLDADLVRWVYDTYRLPVLNYYGLTETCGFCIGHSLSTFLQYPGGIGFPVDASLTVVNDDGRVLPPREEGELCVSGPNLMSGYFRQPELTDRVMRKGRFHTGDRAWLTDEGNVVLVGRKNNFIKTALTELVYFEEVELALEKHPKVREAGVCGFTSGLGDERLAAFVVVGEEVANEDRFFRELQAYIERHLGAHKVPSVFYLLDSLPRGSLGKLLRRKLEMRLQ